MERTSFKFNGNLYEQFYIYSKPEGDEGSMAVEDYNTCKS